MGGRPRRDADEPPALIAVDSSVWIDHFRGRRDLHHVQVLRRAIEAGERLIVGDLVLLELLLGVRDDDHARRVEERLRTFSVEPMMGDDSAARAASHYRTLRAAGITVRKTADLIIGTFCIDRHYRLLHNDRDFEPMHAMLGLRRA